MIRLDLTVEKIGGKDYVYIRKIHDSRAWHPHGWISPLAVETGLTYEQAHELATKYERIYIPADVGEAYLWSAWVKWNPHAFEDTCSKLGIKLVPREEEQEGQKLYVHVCEDLVCVTDSLDIASEDTRWRTSSNIGKLLSKVASIQLKPGQTKEQFEKHLSNNSFQISYYLAGQLKDDVTLQDVLDVAALTYWATASQPQQIREKLVEGYKKAQEKLSIVEQEESIQREMNIAYIKDKHDETVAEYHKANTKVYVKPEWNKTHDAVVGLGVISAMKGFKF